MKKFKEQMKKRWFSNAVTGCIIVLFYIILAKTTGVAGIIKTLFGYISPIVGGCVIAYLMNNLAKFYQRTIFKKFKNEKRQWIASVSLTVFTVIILMIFLLGMLIPQLVSSIQTFMNNLEGYTRSVQKWMENFGLNKMLNKWLKFDSLTSISEAMIEKAAEYVSKNSAVILSTSASVGQGVIGFFIAFILSVYILIAKKQIKSSARRFAHAVMKPANFGFTKSFIRRCDEILSRYIIFNILDSIIVGSLNAIFMAICGMEYTGLVSVIVAVTNLIPTFGPAIGLVIGAFILLMVNPVYALIFIIFTAILQLFDGYYLKPRMFGNTLGVSGLLILVAVIVGGRIAAVPGILLSIPAIAIIDYSYKDYLLPWLEKKRALKDAAEAKADDGIEEIEVTEKKVSEEENE
ncbi:MAG: AI-2E family transporter [Lachnospiraceae bacterium]|nr:AI-2E family transporter [Lachnospiraceae bacterium]